MWSVEYCTGLFVWGMEVCAHLVVGGVCVPEVRGGGLRCWGLCAFVIKSLCRLWVYSVVVRLDSGTIHPQPTQRLDHKHTQPPTP